MELSENVPQIFPKSVFGILTVKNLEACRLAVSDQTCSLGIVSTQDNLLGTVILPWVSGLNITKRRRSSWGSWVYVIPVTWAPMEDAFILNQHLIFQIQVYFTTSLIFMSLNLYNHLWGRNYVIFKYRNWGSEFLNILFLITVKKNKKHQSLRKHIHWHLCFNSGPKCRCDTLPPFSW